MRAPSIQPICVIDEYARIMRIWVWLRPSRPPNRALAAAAHIRRFVELLLTVVRKARRPKGAIFCQDAKIKQFDHDKAIIVLGNQ